MCQYMLTYYAMEQAKAYWDAMDKSQDNDDIDINLPNMSSTLMEKIIEVYKKKNGAQLGLRRLAYVM